MASFLRLLILSLLFSIILPAAANEQLTKDDLATQKELLQLKIDSGRELVQRDLESLKTRTDSLDKRIDDQNNRVGDIGQSVDRFSVLVGAAGILVTILLFFGGLVGYFSVTKKATEEAKSASQKWFDDNQEKLASQIHELEKAAEQARQKIDHSVNHVEQQSNTAIKQIQKGLNAPNEQAQPISLIEQQALRQSVEHIREKPEASYSYEDWNTRAFDAYHSGQHEDAALYWKHASSVPNAGATNTAQALFNRAIALNQLKRHDEAYATYERLIATYSLDNTPAIREQVAQAMLNMGATLGQMQKPTEAIATYKRLIATYSTDSTPALREQVARAMLNMGATLGQMNKPTEAIAFYEKLIATSSPDNTPAHREHVARAMLNMGATLGQMNKSDEAIAAYERMIATYSPDNTPAIREWVAGATLNMGASLGQMNKPEEAIAAYERLIATYSPDNTPAIREQVAKAMVNIGLTLSQMKKPIEAIAAYERLITSHSLDNTPAIREQVAKAMLNIALVQSHLKKPTEAIATYKSLIATYSPDATPATCKLVAHALNGKGFELLMEAKKAWKNRDQALALLSEAQTDLLASLEKDADNGMAYGNLAYVQWLHGNRQVAEESFHAAIFADENGGEELYRATLVDIAQYPTTEDNGFQEMVERLWAEFSATEERASPAEADTDSPAGAVLA